MMEDSRRDEGCDGEEEEEEDTAATATLQGIKGCASTRSHSSSSVCQTWTLDSRRFAVRGSAEKSPKPQKGRGLSRWREAVSTQRLQPLPAGRVERA